MQTRLLCGSAGARAAAGAACRHPGAAAGGSGGRCGRARGDGLGPRGPPGAALFRVILRGFTKRVSRGFFWTWAGTARTMRCSAPFPAASIVSLTMRYNAIQCPRRCPRQFRLDISTLQDAIHAGSASPGGLLVLRLVALVKPYWNLNTQIVAEVVTRFNPPGNKSTAAG